LSDANGSTNMVCAYQCTNGNQGGCNTPLQVAHFFMTKFNATTIRFHLTDYSCWQGTQNISTGGNCCLIPIMTDLLSFTSQTQIEAFPNPADEQLSIRLTTEQSFYGRLSLTNILGEQVLSQMYSSTTGENFLNLDVSNLSAGIYFLELETQTGIQTRKIEIH
ncbi:MAG: T9SS type A sorting domain-containing protein, partial [Bacteroidia bacterium]